MASEQIPLGFMDAATIIREARSRAGLGLRELARRAGTSHATLARYESGDVDPRVGTLIRIVAACGYELRIGLEPPDTSDRRLERAMAAMSPADRARSVAAVAGLTGRATRSSPDPTESPS